MVSASRARQRLEVNDRRRKHSWPICPHTGKQRLGERKDAKLLLEAAQHNRANAELNGRTSGWTVRRSYQCDYCRGWHLTTIAFWDENFHTHRR